MLKLFNTLTRRLEKFKPLQDKKVGLYTCGPTVYDFAHLGNLRTYIFEDILKRVLLAQGYQVKQVMNLTDVDDKTIKAARESGKALKEITDFYAGAFKKDIKKLNIIFPDKFAPATGYIKEMTTAIQNLLRKGVAYKKGGSVYFSIRKFKPYGRLARLDKEGLKAGARVETDEYEKENPADFALWKAWSPSDGKIFWKTALGKGRPGWHIECSTISAKELGQPFDIHAGAVDLIFPHHENEIAQAEAISGKKFANFWLHGEHLLAEGQKMAKSLNNFYTLRDLEQKGFNPLAFRYLALTSHYRSQLNFTWDSLKAAANALNSLYGFLRDLPESKQNSEGG
ncbi:MAG: cysteine--tRNA ligase, partial [Candidatus Magasanikbacteria bacterium]|nr:cysteine--tRNA ligase [Candidatus Magasanikbacteria bacterium]